MKHSLRSQPDSSFHQCLSLILARLLAAQSLVDRKQPAVWVFAAVVVAVVGLVEIAGLVTASGFGEIALVAGEQYVVEGVGVDWLVAADEGAVVDWAAVADGPVFAAYLVVAGVAAADGVEVVEVRVVAVVGFVADVVGVADVEGADAAVAVVATQQAGDLYCVT